MTAKDYLKKSRVQKGLAYAMAGIGSLIVVANIAWNREVEKDEGIDLLFEKTSGGYFIGGGLIAGSVALLAAGEKNKKRSIEMSAGLKMEREQFPFLTHKPGKFPALAITMKL
jgi:hypothetical protein